MGYLGIDASKDFTVNGMKYSRNGNGQFESQANSEAKADAISTEFPCRFRDDLSASLIGVFKTCTKSSTGGGILSVQYAGILGFYEQEIESNRRISPISHSHT